MQPLAVIAPYSSAPAQHAPVYRLEAEILKHPQVELPVEHAFCAGLYARTMRIPAGTVATGAVHRGDSFFVVRQGELASTTEDGGQTILRAGDMHVSHDGSKRAVVALTDCVLTTFHANPTGENDPAVLWNLFTVPAPEVALEHCVPAVLEVSQ